MMYLPSVLMNCPSETQTSQLSRPSRIILSTFYCSQTLRICFHLVMNRYISLIYCNVETRGAYFFALSWKIYSKMTGLPASDE
jgi:hypothetical protein